MFFDQFRCVFSLAGGLFDYNVDEAKQVFEYAIEIANKELLADEEFQMKSHVLEVPFGDDYLISRNLCKMLKVCLAYDF